LDEAERLDEELANLRTTNLGDRPDAIGQRRRGRGDSMIRSRRRMAA
jgi:hypothetical protein